MAEQVLKGGLPAVRQAVQKQNEAAEAEGKPPVKAEPLVALAEQMLPRLRSADWRDKAEAALADIDELDLRDLRSVIVAADTGARDEESRTIAEQLRAALNRRVEQEHAAWLAEIAANLAEGRSVRALRLSSHPPKAGAPLPPDMASRLAAATAASLTAEVTQDRWATVLDALAFSPVRLNVVPESLPAVPGDKLLAEVARLAAQLPQIAAIFGVEPGKSGKRPRPRPSRAPPRARPSGCPRRRRATRPRPTRSRRRATSGATTRRGTVARSRPRPPPLPRPPCRLPTSTGRAMPVPLRGCSGCRGRRGVHRPTPWTPTSASGVDLAAVGAAEADPAPPATTDEPKAQDEADAAPPVEGAADPHRPVRRGRIDARRCRPRGRRRRHGAGLAATRQDDDPAVTTPRLRRRRRRDGGGCRGRGRRRRRSALGCLAEAPRSAVPTTLDDELPAEAAPATG